MKTNEIIQKYDLTCSVNDLNEFIRSSGLSFKQSMSGIALVVQDFDVPALVEAYKEKLDTEKQEQDRLAAEESAIKEKAVNIPITSSYGFEGYRIVKYGGYVSGDEIMVVASDFFLGNPENMTERIKTVRRTAISELKEAAATIGCNAVIALDFDYINLESNSLFKDKSNFYLGLTANGTAVQIEKIS